MRRCLALALVASVALGGACSPAKSQEAQVIDAIAARFPDGKPRCLRLVDDAVGIHVGVPFGQRLFYPSTGPTSPTNHLFVFYAAPARDPVPELVADLAARGVLKLTTVQATVDAETSRLGPEARSADGFYSHPTVYGHETSRFPVSIWRTARADELFDYQVQSSARLPAFSPASFPSRLYDGPLPPPDRRYALPTVDPYALSIVTSACYRETPSQVLATRPDMAFDGSRLLEADVLLDQHPAAWMLTQAFSRAAIGPGTASITKPRRAVLAFKVTDGKLFFLNERSR